MNSETGEKLDWAALPVEDKGWNEHQEDRGGFIQEVTGWKPVPLQKAVKIQDLTDRR